MSGRPRLLIEEWFPIREVGVECQRERSASSALPPLYYLHVYWARRPLAVSRAAILASLLPPETDRERFLHWLGIHGDPVTARQRILSAREVGEKVEGGYGYPRAFTYTPNAEDRDEFQSLMERLWGTRTPQVLDPMAGGGSIPFEAVRLGLPTIGNDLNPVAHVIQRATIEYPARYGLALAEKIQHYAQLVGDRARAVLEPCFPVQEGEQIHAYIWARTITCPHCAATIPLSPNWWLERDKVGNGWASMPVVHGNSVSFEVVQIVRGKGPGQFDPGVGSVKRGIPLCPVCHHTVPDAEVKRQAQTHGMGHQLVAIVAKRNGARHFRPPSKSDLEGVKQAALLLQAQLPAWETAGLVPDEPYPINSNDPRPANYGMPRWCDLFSRRQLLAHLVYLDAITKVQEEAARELDADEARAVGVYLAFMLDKAVDYNSSLTHYDGTRNKICNTFDRHDFSIKWSFAEFDAARQLWRWASNQVLDAYRDIAKLIYPNSGRYYAIFKSATHLPDVGTGTVAAICVDPPYYDNVMYAELADFFYVWQKRSLGHLFPEVFASRLTNKDDEAVANPARFKGMGKSAKKLAEEDYEKKMQTVFTEAHRVLRDDGVMTVMFTHKRTEAWDALAAALMNAGFVITASWPVHTESEHSLHIAKKNAAESTILLVCRKRPAGAQGGWWEEIQPLIGKAVRARLPQFEEAGITGVDLYLAAFGPALQLLGEAWPVRDATGNLIRPEVALAEARKAVTEHRLAALAQQALGLDPVTRFTILAWDAFKATQFPFDEARRLSIACGVSVDLLRNHGLVERKGKYLNLLTPEERVRSGKLKLRTRDYPYLIDAIHAAMAIYAEDGAAAAGRFLEELGLARSPDFIRAVEAFLKALPPVRPEYASLLRMAATVLEGQIDLTGLPAPVTPAPDEAEEAEEEESEE